MNYCIMNTQKIKTMKSMRTSYMHNYRKGLADNADASRHHLNEELIKLGTKENGEEKTYYDAYRERMKDLEYYKTHKVRKNAVYAIEIVTSFSHDAKVDTDAWKKANVEWMKKTFNVAPDGKDNVISVVMHADETTIHCHTFIVPIDENGKLNASRFLDGPKKLHVLQNSYAKEMEQFNLNRGRENSQIKYETIRAYNNLLNANKEPPEPLPGEMAKDYIKRYKKELQEKNLANLHKQQQIVQDAKRKASNYKVNAKEEIELELERTKPIIERETKELKDNLQSLKKEYIRLSGEISALEDRKRALDLSLSSHERELEERRIHRKKAYAYDKLSTALEEMRYTYPKETAFFMEKMNEIEQKKERTEVEYEQER